MLIRRLRGLAISSLLWAVPWAGFGVLAGLAYDLGLFPSGIVIFGPKVLGGFAVTFGLVGAVVGGISGAVFAAALMLAERRRNGVAELSAWRVGTWAAIASGATILALTGGALTPAGICAVAGFGAGAGGLVLAKRGGESEPRAIGAREENDETL